MTPIDHLTLQEQECIAEVQKAPEAEKKSVFKKVCEKLGIETQTKLQALLFAGALAVASPTLAQNQTENHPRYQEAYTMVVERFPNLILAQQEFFSILYAKGLDIVDPSKHRQFEGGFGLIVSAVENERYGIVSIVERMIQRGMIPADHEFTTTLMEIGKEIDIIGLEEIAKIRKEAEEAGKRAEEAGKRAEEAGKRAEEYRRLSEMLNRLQN